ncbi:MAG: PEP-CTERM sorting domain-containing protein [Acetobacteraceae bacterium]|nr:PEP-CTERM sorting domain-containing protein [Pseudomonadota bacterium]
MPGKSAADQHIESDRAPSAAIGQAAWLAGAAIAVMPAAAQAGFIAPSVAAYRLLFIDASGIQATSSLFSDYDTRLQTDAAFNTQLPATTWSVVASVGTAANNSAKDHICGGPCNTTVPIYGILWNGTDYYTYLIANSLSDFFSGSVSTAPYTGLFGDNYTFYEIWTGSDATGGALASHTLGSSDPGYGFAGSSSQYLYADRTAPASRSYNLYGISDEILVPEPATGIAMLSGGLAVLRVLRRRRRH